MVPLSDDHFLEFFDCGRDNNSLGEWLSNKAREENKQNLSRVWVLANNDAPETPVGYFCLSDHQISPGEMPKALRKGISSSRSHPAKLLGKFALSEDSQGQGLGEHLMAGVFGAYLQSNQYSAARFLVLHTRNEPVTQYYEHRFGFVALGEGPRDAGSTMVLPTATVEQAMAGVDLSRFGKVA